MVEEKIRFLADESCDFAVVRSLRSAGYDVIAVSESCPSAPDVEVLRAAVEDKRILITEDRQKNRSVPFFALGQCLNATHASAFYC